MRLDQVELPGGILKLKLTGALDIAGANDVEGPLGTIAASHNKVIVDFTDVTFLASIGIRVLMKAARAIGSRAGRLAVFNPSEDARKVLRSTGIDKIVPVFADEQAAVAELSK
jgi:anti-sigma B factor antagonist